MMRMEIGVDRVERVAWLDATCPQRRKHRKSRGKRERKQKYTLIFIKEEKRHRIPSFHIPHSSWEEEEEEDDDDEEEEEIGIVKP